MPDLEIQIGAEPINEEEPFAADVKQAEAADSQLFQEVSPKGRFSSKSLNALVEASNKLLPIFGQTPDYPPFDAGNYEVWPEDFVRVISMFAAASLDAVTEDVVPAELAISLDGVTDDQDLQIIAGKVNGLAKSKDFKKWLKEAPEQEEERPEPVGPEPAGAAPSEEDIDELFMSRL